MAEKSLREQVAWASRILAMEGYADLTLGHVSARDEDGRVYIKRKGVSSYRTGNDPNYKAAGTGHLRYFLAPLIGFGVIIWVWSSMDWKTLVVGTTWLVVGIIYSLVLTKGWRELPPELEL